MGDRRMAEIKTTDGSLFIYTHWGGEGLPDLARRAIAFAKGRWQDESYCLRILVDQITVNNRDSQTGAGLMLQPSVEDEYNNDKPSVIIDIPKQTLQILPGGRLDFAECTAVEA